MRTRLWIWALPMALGIALAMACGSDGGDGPTDASTNDGGLADGTLVDGLAIDPPTATLVVKVTDPPQTLQFKALATIGSAPAFQVPAVFSVDNVIPGTISTAGLYTTSNASGGVVNVSAVYGGKTATAVLTIKLEADVTSGNVPANPATFFDPPNTVVVADPTKSPTLVYPVPETKFPQNLYRTLFNWRPAGNDLFLLRYESPNLKLNVYTDGVQATCKTANTGGSCWETVQKDWAMIAGSNAGGAVSLTLFGTNTKAKGTVYASKPYTFTFSKSPVPGAIYYWSTTAKGVRRGTLDALAPSNFLTPAEADGNCVACHTLSRNGKRLAADVGGEKLWVVDVVKQIPPPRVFTAYNNAAIANAWATFNPDTTRIVSASNGVLRLIDGNTGAPVGGGNGVIAGPSPFGTMPDWAPDGKHLVFVQSAANKDRGLTASSVAWLSVAGDVFSGPQVILASAGATDNYAYPMFDPTSQWIAVARGAAKTDNDPSAQIMIAAAKAASTAQQQVRADTLVNDGTVATGVQNSMPTWAPTSADNVLWIAFTSTRDYGTVLAAGSTYGNKRDQLWIAAIDLTKLGQGDASFPAFRVPFVELSEDAHRPFWAEDAFVPPPVLDGGVPDAGPCLQLGADCTTGTCCNGLQCLPVGNTYQCTVPPPN